MDVWIDPSAPSQGIAEKPGDRLPLEVPSRFSVAFHWAGAIAVLIALVGGLTAVYFSSGCCSGVRATSFAYHAYAGFLVLAIVVLRLSFRVSFSWPKGKPGGFHPGALVAGVTHWLLYLIMIVAPLSGWIAAAAMPCCFGLPGVPDPGVLARGIGASSINNGVVAYSLHVALVWGLLGLVLVHIVAALMHHVVLRDDTLAKMLPGRKSIVRSRAGKL